VKTVYIHGRAQEGKTELELRTYWNAGLIEGYRHANIDPVFDVEKTRAPFYADRLVELTDVSPETIERGEPHAKSDPLVAAMIKQMAARAHVNPDEVLEDRVLQRGMERWEWVQGLARAIDTHVPWISASVVDRVTTDVSAYLNRDHVRDVVHDIVRPVLLGEPCVVVGHSLGSVVGYSLLVELGDTVDVPLYVTVGSPLGLTEIQACLEERHPLEFPRGVGAWFNASDERDVVALYSSLDSDTFLSGIENHPDVRNSGRDPHDIVGYLADPVVARRISGALG